MWTASVTVDIDEVFRATEVLADLRNVAEVLFHPLRMAAFWDSQADEAHPCPYESRGQCCPHRLHLDDPAWVPYSETVERDMSAVLEVVFPHAGVHVYLK